MIEYITICYENYNKLFCHERKENLYYIEYYNGEKRWIVNGNLHREDGPAIMYPHRSIRWCINGRQYPFVEWCNKLNKSDEEIIFLKLKYT